VVVISHVAARMRGKCLEVRGWWEVAIGGILRMDVVDVLLSV
jgi:hypothetical protein